MAAQNGKGSKSRHVRIRGRSRTACPEAVCRAQERPKGEDRVPISHGQAPRGNARGGQSAALAARRAPKSGASRIWDHLRGSNRVIPKGVVHSILRESGDAVPHKRKQGRHKWARYERWYSNSMWHTDYKQLDDGRRLTSYEDDASRFITGWCVFGEATRARRRGVGLVIAQYGKPRSILSDRGFQFYAI